MAELVITELDRDVGKSKPLYQQISRQLRTQIEAGRVQVGERLPSVSSLVKHCKVDYKTVNLSLQLLEKDGLIHLESGRGKGSLVSRNSTRKHLVKYIRWGQDSLSLEIDDGIKRFAKEKGLEYFVVNASLSHEQCINTLVHPVRNTRGIIMMPHEYDGYRKAILQALDSGTKIVFVDRILEGVPVSSVCIDNVNGAYKATKHLLSMHGQPVYFFGSTKDPSSTRDRFKGWSLAMQQYSYLEQESYVYSLPKLESEMAINLKKGKQCAHETALKLLKAHKKCSVFCSNDITAMSMYLAAEELGLRVGKDLFLFGFGDYPLCEKLPVPLSSVKQRNEQVGYEAANLLHMDIVGALKHPINRVLSADLCIRASAGEAAVRSTSN